MATLRLQVLTGSFAFSPGIGGSLVQSLFPLGKPTWGLLLQRQSHGGAVALQAILDEELCIASRAESGSRMSRPNDARALRSREALRAAFLALIEKRPLDQISIRDITAEAGVSYPVFFRRYGSKEELLEDIAAEEVRRLMDLTLPVFEAGVGGSSLVVMCEYVDGHRTLWKQLLTGGAADAMRAEFARIAGETAATRPRANPWLPVELATAFVTNGLFDILAWWLRQPAGYPIQNVVKLIEVLVVRSTSQPVDVQLV